MLPQTSIPVNRRTCGWCAAMVYLNLLYTHPRTHVCRRLSIHLSIYVSIHPPTYSHCLLIHARTHFLMHVHTCVCVCVWSGTEGGAINGGVPPGSCYLWTLENHPSVEGLCAPSMRVTSWICEFNACANIL